MKSFIKETNILAIFSFLIAVFAYVYEFIISHEYGTTVLNSSGVIAVVIGIISLIYIRKRKERGKWFAILGIILGLLAASII